MKYGATKLFFLGVFFFAGLTLPAAAQNLTGIWRGYFITADYDQYKIEIQIKQNSQQRVTGVSYSYLTTVFYGKASLTGFYNKASKKLLVQEIKTVEVRMSGSSVACIMKYLMAYSKSGNEEFLEGTYTSKYEKSDERYGINRGESCGGGKVFLRKVTTSDFYVEPFLRNTPAPRKPSIAEGEPKTPAPQKPTTKPPVTQKNTPVQPKKEPPVVQQPKKDTVQKEDPPAAVKVEVPKVEVKIPPTTRSRENELVQTIRVDNENITVRLYDNGEIDDDTISVYMDNKLVLSNQRLTAAPLTIKLKMDESNPEHVLVLVAENLGRIPPNTSLMIVQDGDKRYQVRITSTNQKNAMVRFRYEKAGGQ